MAEKKRYMPIPYPELGRENNIDKLEDIWEYFQSASDLSPQCPSLYSN